MELTNYVKEFRSLQKTGKVRVADFCRERMLDYYEMVEALKRNKMISEAAGETAVSGELELTDLPVQRPDTDSLSFIREVSLRTPSDIRIQIHGITAPDLMTVLEELMKIRPC